MMLLLLGMAGFFATYTVYARLLGAVDGLPELPPAFLEQELGNAEFEIPDAPYSPTLVRLGQAFGKNSPEVTDSIEYKTKLELRDKGMVFACGQPVFATEATPFVTVAPFSVAFFGKPRTGSARRPGETVEISTFHADKAVLEFDRPVASSQDLTGKARLIGMALTSTPDNLSPDPRRGQIEVVNNQRSADPAEHLLFRTPGPLYYKTASSAGRVNDPNAPQIWSEAAVEVVDRRNLPRPIRAASLTPVRSHGDDLRGRNAVANILLGVTLPPPTITAEGIKIYLAEQEVDSAQDKRNVSGYAGVKRIELSEKLQMNLWSDGGSGFPGGPTDAKAPAPPTPGEQPAAMAGLAGGLADAAAVARMFDATTLLVIETLGPFVYDFEANIAQFAAASSSNPAVSNHVTVTRLSAAGGQDNLFCKQLEVEFADAADRKTATLPTGDTGNKPAIGGGMKIKRLHATGEHVFIAVEGEQLLAQGTDLRYRVDAVTNESETIMKGSPVVAVRDRNRLQGGDAETAAEVFLTSRTAKVGKTERLQTDVEVRGPGRIELYDAASNDNTLQATWGTSLVHKKEIVGGLEQSLLTFNGGGSFVDVRGGMRLTADRLQLWLAESGRPADAKPAGETVVVAKVLPQRLVAVGHVDGQSADTIIRKTDQLTVAFRDVAPPPAPARPTPAAATGPIVATPPPAEPIEPEPDRPTPTPVPKPEPEPAKPPMYISARLVDATIIRYPRTTPAKEAGEGATEGLKYEMERARCEDRVMVHQDPKDPTKSPRGTDIYGTKLLLDQSPSGGVMTVYGGTAAQPAQVYFEDMSLFGPVVVLDQPNNAASVDGRGLLKMPSSSDLGGGPTDTLSELEIQWTQRMRFEGALSKAEFVGLVHAVQEPRKTELAAEPTPATLTARSSTDARPTTDTADATWTRSRVICHRLDVTFDKPIYFNNLRDDNPSAGPVNERAKLRTAVCTPIPDDELADDPTAGVRTVTYLQETYRRTDDTVEKAQRVTARQLNVDNVGREQRMDAAGPGEVRILQYEARDPEAVPGPGGTGQDAEELKLTVVRFPSRMIARDKGKVYQDAVFSDGAKIVQVPSQDLNQQVAEHDLPDRGVFLTCTDVLNLSSARVRPGAVARQTMTANGNAEFQTDKYHGFGNKIAYDNDKVVLTGTETDPAKLYKKYNGQVDRRDYTTGREIIRSKNGTVTATDSVGGTLNTGGP